MLKMLSHFTLSLLSTGMTSRCVSFISEAKVRSVLLGERDLLLPRARVELWDILFYVITTRAKGVVESLLSRPGAREAINLDIHPSQVGSHSFIKLYVYKKGQQR